MSKIKQRYGLSRKHKYKVIANIYDFTVLPETNDFNLMNKIPWEVYKENQER